MFGWAFGTEDLRGEAALQGLPSSMGSAWAVWPHSWWLAARGRLALF